MILTYICVKYPIFQNSPSIAMSSRRSCKKPRTVQTKRSVDEDESPYEEEHRQLKEDREKLMEEMKKMENVKNKVEEEKAKVEEEKVKVELTKLAVEKDRLKVEEERVKMEKLSQELRKQVECPVCLTMPREDGAIPCCPQGHFVCSTCRDKLVR